MSTQEEWRDKVRKVYDKIKSHKSPYSITINNTEIHIFPNVFSPKYFTDSIWFAQTLNKIVGKHTLLEIGTGTGIIALFAALNGAKATATDINPDAIKNAQHNFQTHNLEIKAYCGDMYDPLPPNAQFDYIFWNHPFNRGDNPNEEDLLKAGFDFEYQSLEKYISQAHLHLNQNGKLLLGTGNFASIEEIKKLASKHNYKLKIMEKITTPLTVDSSMENEYIIYEFKTN